jgi:hypothetical protein
MAEAKAKLAPAEQPDWAPKYTIVMDDLPENERPKAPEGETKHIQEVVDKLSEALDKTMKEVKADLKAAVAPGATDASLLEGITATLMMRFAANKDQALRPKVEAPKKTEPEPMKNK